MCKGYIYRHWLINDKGIEKSYVGQTIETLSRRWKNDGKGYLDHNDDTKFARAIKKYGWDSFHHEVIGIVEADTKEQLILDLDEWEKYYIEKYDSFHNGYNSTTGGGNGSPCEETRQKISDSLMGRFVGKDNPCAIKVICLTTNMIFDCIIDASDWCQLSGSSGIVSCCKGETKSAGKHPQTNEPLQWAYYEDYINGNYEYKTYDEVMKEVRKQQSDKMKEKYSDGKAPNKKSVVCLNTGQIFETVTKASEWCNGSMGDITTCCSNTSRYQSGEHPITKEKLQWAYYEDYINGNYEFKDSKELEKQHRQKQKETMKGKYKGDKNPRAKAVICLETLEVFTTIKEAQNTYNINNISACCKGKLKTAGGKHWMYYDKYLKQQNN